MPQATNTLLAVSTRLRRCSQVGPTSKGARHLLKSLAHTLSTSCLLDSGVGRALGLAPWQYESLWHGPISWNYTRWAAAFFSPGRVHARSTSWGNPWPWEACRFAFTRQFPQGCVGHRYCIGQTNINKLVFTFSLRCRCQPLYAFITAMCWDIELIRVELVWSFSPMFSLARRRKFSKGFYSILRSASMKRPCAHSRKPIRNLVKIYVILEGPPVMR